MHAFNDYAREKNHFVTINIMYTRDTFIIILSISFISPFEIFHFIDLKFLRADEESSIYDPTIIKKTLDK